MVLKLNLEREPGWGLGSGSREILLVCLGGGEGRGGVYKEWDAS